MSGDITKITMESIDENVNVKQSLQSIVEEHFDLWEYRLAPVLRSRGKSVYKEVAKILHRAGYENANEKSIGVYFRRIRKSRGAKNDI